MENPNIRNVNSWLFYTVIEYCLRLDADTNWIEMVTTLFETILPQKLNLIRSFDINGNAKEKFNITFRLQRQN